MNRLLAITAIVLSILTAGIVCLRPSASPVAPRSGASATIAEPPFAASVYAFGAVGDGVTDDQAAFSNCLAASASNGAACWAPVPASSYFINSAPTIAGGSRLIVAPGATFSGASAAVLTGMATPSTMVGTGTVAAPTSAPFLAFQPVDTTKTPWVANVQVSKFNSTEDNLVQLGWDSNRANATAPVMRLDFESDYEVTPGVHWFETYIEAWPTGQGSFFRPIYVNEFQSTGEGQTIIAHGLGNTANDYIQLENGEQNVNYFCAGPNASTQCSGITIGASTLNQTVNAQNYNATTGSVVWASSGSFFFQTASANTLVISGDNAGFFVNSVGTGGGTSVVEIGNAQVAPTSVPSTGIVLASVGQSLEVWGNGLQPSGPVGGISGNNAFSWASATVAVTSGATNTLSASQYNSPHLKFTGTLSGTGTIIVLPATDGACWDMDFTAMTFSTNTLALKANGNTWGTTITSTASTETPHVCYSAGAGKLVGISMTQ